MFIGASLEQDCRIVALTILCDFYDLGRSGYVLREELLVAFVGFYLRIFLEEFGYQLIFLLDRVDATALDRHRIHLKFHLRCHRHFPIQCFLRDGSPSE